MHDDEGKESCAKSAKLEKDHGTEEIGADLDIVHDIESELFVEEPGTESDKEIGEESWDHGEGQNAVVSDESHSDDLDLVTIIETDTGLEERDYIEQDEFAR